MTLPRSSKLGLMTVGIMIVIFGSIGLAIYGYMLLQ